MLPVLFPVNLLTHGFVQVPQVRDGNVRAIVYDDVICCWGATAKLIFHQYFLTLSLGGKLPNLFKDRQYFYQALHWIKIHLDLSTYFWSLHNNPESQHARFSEKLPGIKSRAPSLSCQCSDHEATIPGQPPPLLIPRPCGREWPLYVLHKWYWMLQLQQSVVRAAQASGPGFNGSWAFLFPLFCFIPSNVCSLLSTWSQKTLLLNFDWICQLSLGLSSFPGSPAPELKYAGRA